MKFSLTTFYSITQMYKIPVRKESTLQVSVFVAGLTALITQIVMLRTFMTILNGNELIIGVILCNWMLLTGAGALIGRNGRLDYNALTLLHILTGLLPAALVFFIYLAKAKFFQPGLLPGLNESWLFSLMAMAPFCLSSGAMFTIFARLWSRHALQNKTSRVYAIEAWGSLTGSLLFTLLLIRIFQTPEILVLLASANFTAAILLSLSFHKRRRISHGIFIGLLVWIMFHFVADWYGLVRSMNYPGQKILEDTETPYGNLVVTSSGEQVNVFDNGVSAFSSRDVISLEETVHYAILQVEDPENILIVSGNPKGLWNEIRKYEGVAADYVETNPALVRIADDYFGLPVDSLFRVYREDPLRFIRTKNKTYDVVLLNIPPPNALQFNRFYSLEFFRLLKSALSPAGTISLEMEGNLNYLSHERLELYSVIVSTVNEVFDHVILIPGSSTYLLASDGNLSHRIADSVIKSGIQNEYVNRFYLEDELLEMQGTQLKETLKGDSPVNRDFRPRAFFLAIRHWLSWYRLEMEWVAFIAAVPFLLLLLFMKPAPKAMFVAGFTATSVEIMTLMVFQVIFGYLYQALALLFAAFMSGLAMGTWLAGKSGYGGIKTFILNQGLIAVSALLIPGVLFTGVHTQMPALILEAILYIIMLFSGIVTGIHFTRANALGRGNTGKRASTAYGADLAGSAGGAVITATVLIPVAGLISSGVILAVINLIMMLLLFLTGKRELKR